MKHAYLIVAHNEFEILKVLLSMLDDERNDVFLHIDKKVGHIDFSQFWMKKARFCILESRLDVRWGDLSQIKVELLLFETAQKKGPYDYYHLLSGTDLPIQTQDYIHRFFEKRKGCEFVGYSQGEGNLRDLEWKVYQYHLFCRLYKTSHKCLWKIANSIRKRTLKIQKYFHYRRSAEIEFKKGTNWVSITDDLVTILLAEKAFILKRFKYVSCGDEIFVQSILWNSYRRNKIYTVNGELRGDTREINWDRGGPYIWKKEDAQFLQESDKLFARKFSSDDMAVVLWIKELYS